MSQPRKPRKSPAKKARVAQAESLEAVRLGHAVERLDRVEAKLELLLEKLDRTLMGDLSSPGVILRLDRVEQTVERSRWFARAILGAAISALVGTIWVLLRG